jgi:protocatechuate 3,4-dioxygenase beta subunit
MAGNHDLPFDPDLGLSQDLPHLLQRRTMLKVLGGGALLALAGCGSSSSSKTTTAATTGSTAGSTTGSAATTAASTTAAPTTAAGGTSGGTSTLTEIPEETAGPFPGDGSNGPDVLSESGVVRADIRSSFGSSTTVATGVPLTVELTIVDVATGAGKAGAAVYIWHCDQQGRYSMYSQGATGENYLRGVQEADADGTVSFTTIYPACYSGRWPHIHFEVYEALADITSAKNKIATSQLAMPDAVNKAVFATDGYEGSVSNYAQTSLTRDMVFRDDGGIHETPTVSGDVTAGYTAKLAVGVST